MIKGIKYKRKFRYRVLWWFGGLVALCFVASWFLAGDYEIWSSCGGKWRFFQKVQDCEYSLSPLVVRMNAETIDPRVSSLLPPLSFTPDVGWHIFGTDALGRDVFAGLLYGGQRSLIIGFVSGILAVALGWLIGLWSVFVEYIKTSLPYYWIIMGGIVIYALGTGRYYIMLIPAGMLILLLIKRYRYMRRLSLGSGWWWSRGIEWYQALPDLLILMVLSASIGMSHIGVLIFIIVAVVWPSMALVARRVGNEVTGSEYFQQALRNNISKADLLLHYLWANTRSYIRAILPLVVARIILLESTLSFLGLGLPPDMVTIGSMVSGARDHIEAWWLIVFGSLFIFILVYPLQRIEKNPV